MFSSEHAAKRHVATRASRLAVRLRRRDRGASRESMVGYWRMSGAKQPTSWLRWRSGPTGALAGCESRIDADNAMWHCRRVVA